MHAPSAQTPKTKENKRRSSDAQFTVTTAWLHGGTDGAQGRSGKSSGVVGQTKKNKNRLSPGASFCLNGLTEGEGGQRQRPARHLNAEGTGRRSIYSVKVKGFVH